MSFTIVLLLILGFGLMRDYNRDKGLHAKAKVTHAIILALIIINYGGTFQILGSIIRNFDKVQESFSVPVGFVPGQIHFTFYLVHTALALVILYFAAQMINRNKKAKGRLLALLPLLAFVEIFSFYRGWIIDGDDLGFNHAVIILIGIIVMGGSIAVIYKIYKSRFMVDFFEEPVSEVSGENKEVSGERSEID